MSQDRFMLPQFMTNLSFDSVNEIDDTLRLADIIKQGTPYSFTYLIIKEQLLNKNYSHL